MPTGSAPRMMNDATAFTIEERHPAHPDAEAVRSRRLVEIGWILAGRLEKTQRKAAIECRDCVLEFLSSQFPDFDWRLPVVHREKFGPGMREEPVAYLEQAASERNAQHWDFAVLVTGADLVSHYREEASAAVSRALAATVVSMSRLASDSALANADAATMVRRMRTLVLHGLGHLVGLGHCDEPGNIMAPADETEELDRPRDFNGEQQERFSEELRDVADQRLEEDRRYGALWPGLFYLLATWVNRGEILKALWEAKPWQFAFRFSRLTAAAVSAMFVLIVTAEVWELAQRQSATVIAATSSVAVFATTLYVLVRQRLFLRRQRRLNELTVMTNVSTLLIVLAGMATTYLLMAGIALALGTAFFSPNLLHGWTGRATASVGIDEYLRLGCFTASLSIFIGALGASFERHQYFRHVIFVDEEM